MLDPFCRAPQPQAHLQISPGIHPPRSHAEVTLNHAHFPILSLIYIGGGLRKSRKITLSHALLGPFESSIFRCPGPVKPSWGPSILFFQCFSSVQGLKLADFKGWVPELWSLQQVFGTHSRSYGLHCIVNIHPKESNYVPGAPSTHRMLIGALNVELY